MSSPKLEPIKKVSRVFGGGRLNVKNPISAKEQQKGCRKTTYKGKLL
jgi:hypothetical protein